MAIISSKQNKKRTSERVTETERGIEKQGHTALNIPLSMTVSMALSTISEMASSSKSFRLRSVESTGMAAITSAIGAISSFEGLRMVVVTRLGVGKI